MHDGYYISLGPDLGSQCEEEMCVLDKNQNSMVTLAVPVINVTSGGDSSVFQITG